jgi:RHS repeat-associated protein
MDAFGEVTNMPANPIASHFFTGRRFDFETELYHNRNRQYSPSWGRFTTTDPIDFSGGYNLYRYCGNDPVNYIDPWGLWMENIFNDSSQRVDHMNEAVSASEFVDYSGGKTLRELQNESGEVSLTSSGSGPIENRYVKDPANPDQVIDMRHFLIIGQLGELAGFLVELGQIGNASAFNAQDFLSNSLGTDFFNNYYNRYKDVLSLDEILEKYFKDRTKPEGKK